jgi:hypothetical protein
MSIDKHMHAKVNTRHHGHKLNTSIVHISKNVGTLQKCQHIMNILHYTKMFVLIEMLAHYESRCSMKKSALYENVAAL